LSDRHIYLSPHADDVALSCGGQIFDQTRRGAAALVVTFFAATPPPIPFSDFAQGQHAKWQTQEDAMAARRAEDRAAYAIVGAEPLYLDYLDCIYRLHPQTGAPMYASEEGIFGEVDPAEAEWHVALAGRIAAIAGPPRPDLTLYAPLTVGHHVDHQLIWRAAHVLVARGYRLTFYEDHPYAMRPGMLDAALASQPALQPELVHISDAAMDARVAAIACYRSQIKTLFGDLATMEAGVRAYCQALAGGVGYAERYWLPGPSEARHA